jgi:hypothetical protein
MLDDYDVPLNRLTLVKKLICNHLNVHVYHYVICHGKYLPYEKQYLQNLNREIVIYIDLNDTVPAKEYFDLAVSNKFVKKIYCTNLKYKHSKCEFVPLGLGLWGGGDFGSIAIKLNTMGYYRNHCLLGKYCYYMRTPIDFKQPIHYISLDFYNGGSEFSSINKAKNKVWIYRKKFFNMFLSKKSDFNSAGFDFCYSEKRLNVGETWNQIHKATFVISPPGNGWDCHRTYETIILGRIPIILYDENIQAFDLMKRLGAIIVRDYKEINSSFLKKYMIDLKTNYKFNPQIPSELTLDYWTNKISNH